MMMGKWAMRGLALGAVLAAASPAMATVDITSVGVFGSVNGTIWKTPSFPNYTAFIGSSINNFFNGANQALVAQAPVALKGLTNYVLAGDGYPINDDSTTPSDPKYYLFVTLTDSVTKATTLLEASFTEPTTLNGKGTFTSLLSGGLDGRGFSLTNFSWTRTPVNFVGPNTTAEDANQTGGSADDYIGKLAISAVPEPATWAMMIGGFGLLGASMRRRRTSATTVFA